MVANLLYNLRHGGVFSGEGLNTMTQKIFAERIGDPYCTFGEFQEYHHAALNENHDFFIGKCKEAYAKREAYTKALGENAIAYEFEVLEDDGTADIEASAFKMMEIASSFRGLQMTGTRISRDGDGKRGYETDYFNAETSPELSISKAVHISACYPFMFKYVELSDGRRYQDGGLNRLSPLSPADEGNLDGTLFLYTTEKENLEQEYFTPANAETALPTGAAERLLSQIMAVAMGVEEDQSQAGEQDVFQRLAGLVFKAAGRKEIEVNIGGEDYSSWYEAGVAVFVDCFNRFKGARQDLIHSMSEYLVPLDRSLLPNGQDFSPPPEAVEEACENAYQMMKEIIFEQGGGRRNPLGPVQEVGNSNVPP